MNLYIEGRGESPKFVAANPGVESGLERSHYSAASLVEEAASLGSASDRNMIVSAGQEDIYSMGSLATDYLSTTIEKIRYALAIELLASIRTYEIAEPDVPDRAETILEGLREEITAEGLTAKVEEVENRIFDGTVTDLASSANVDLPVMEE
jgi:histidine ammonia-lyase